jgi:acetyl-CoA carboxylase carboxyltransferase component
MALLKLVLGLLIIGCIAVIVSELRKRHKVSQLDEQVAADLRDELADVEKELFRADVEEDVVDAKIQLNERRKYLEAKLATLEPTSKKKKKKKAPK